MSPSPVASDATELALELPALLQLIAHLSTSDLGRQAVAELRPFDRLAELEQRRGRYEDARRLLVARSLVPHCERAFWPLWPWPEVLPVPEPMPRPIRLRAFAAPGLSLN